MNNLLSYCGLVDARIRASNKDLPVTESFGVWPSGEAGHLGLTQRPWVRFSQSDGTKFAVDTTIRTESSE